MEEPGEKPEAEIRSSDDMVTQHNMRQNKSTHAMLETIPITQQRQQTIHQKQTSIQNSYKTNNIKSHHDNFL